jgi:integrating conjugative element protein (TIGR03752 family)
VKNNPVLKYLVIPFLILAIILLVKMFSGGSSKQEGPVGPAPLTQGQGKTLGVDGDTPTDTLRTIVAESKQLKAEVAKSLTNNNDLKQQNDELQKRLQNIDKNMDSKLDSARESLKQESQRQNQSIVETLQKQLNALSNKQNTEGTPASDLPIGFGVQPGDGQSFQGAHSLDIVWIEPQDATPVDVSGKPIPAGSNQTANGFNFPTSFGPTLDRGQNALSTGAQNVANEISPQDARKQVRKVYTLPQNSTLMGSVAMSALIGRVPIDGTVNDPYPFKVLIGPDNLTANGIDLPVPWQVVPPLATGHSLACAG